MSSPQRSTSSELLNPDPEWEIYRDLIDVDRIGFDLKINVNCY